MNLSDTTCIMYFSASVFIRLTFYFSCLEKPSRVACGNVYYVFPSKTCQKLFLCNVSVNRICSYTQTMFFGFENCAVV